MYVCGSNSFGQLGDGGSSTKVKVPKLVEGIEGVVSQISSKYFHNVRVHYDLSLFTLFICTLNVIMQVSTCAEKYSKHPHLVILKGIKFMMSKLPPNTEFIFFKMIGVSA